MTEAKKDIRFGEWSTKEIDVIDSLNLLTAKPALFLVNMSKNDFIREPRTATLCRGPLLCEACLQLARTQRCSQRCSQRVQLAMRRTGNSAGLQLGCLLLACSLAHC